MMSAGWGEKRRMQKNISDQYLYIKTAYLRRWCIVKNSKCEKKECSALEITFSFKSYSQKKMQKKKFADENIKNKRKNAY